MMGEFNSTDKKMSNILVALLSKSINSCAPNSINYYALYILKELILLVSTSGVTTMVKTKPYDILKPEGSSMQ